MNYNPYQYPHYPPGTPPPGTYFEPSCLSNFRKICNFEVNAIQLKFSSIIIYNKCLKNFFFEVLPPYFSVFTEFFFFLRNFSKCRVMQIEPRQKRLRSAQSFCKMILNFIVRTISFRSPL